MEKKGHPTPEDIRAINRYFTQPFPEKFDEWTEEDFERFWELFEAYKARIYDFLEQMRLMFERMRPHIMVIGEKCKELLEAAGWRWDEEKGEWIEPLDKPQ